MSRQRCAVLFSLIFLGILPAPIARATDQTPADPTSCEALFTHTEAELSEVRPDFAHNTRYTHEVESTEIKNQCGARSCWVFSGTSNIEQKLLTTAGKTIDLSEEYLIAIGMRLKAVEALLTPGNQFRPGGLAANVDWLVQNFGAVPDAAWKPRVDFKSPKIAKRMYYFLNARIAKYHLEAARTGDAAAKARLLETAKTDMLALLESYTGAMPEAFEHDGVKYDSPEDFAEQMIPKDDRITIRMAPAEADLPEDIAAIVKKIRPRHVKVKPESVLLPSNAVSRTRPIEQIGQKIVEALARGESVRIGYESVHEFVDEKTGIMSIGAFFIPKGFEPPPRDYRDAYDFKGTGHAVEIIGVDMGSDGKIIKFKIKNSHGTKVGDAGYYHMYWDYFAAFLSAAYIRAAK
ncbi:MAG: hypothetical protein HY074_07190 [Deltaproteobacteria bacterium]|nr:hypothetical protein [Deltaproteobacteria bacterium]